MLALKLVSTRPVKAAILFAVVITMSLPGLAKVEERVIYSFPGNTLIALGGEKIQVEIDRDLFPKFSPGPRPTAWVKQKTLYDSQSTPYGDGAVETWFESTVTYDVYTLPVWAEVEGEANTMWTGWDPQFYSDRIKLESSWTFNGISVYVSYPPGFSGSGDTVTWSGEDDSGTAWRLTHIYSGIRGESWVGLTSVRQNTNGSHYFGSTHTWVSANATDGCSVAF